MINITVYSIDGCESTPRAIELVQKIAAEQNLAIELSQIKVRTSEDAERFKFPGSPTVHINGVDIEPEMRDTIHFGMT